MLQTQLEFVSDEGLDCKLSVNNSCPAFAAVYTSAVLFFLTEFIHSIHETLGDVAIYPPYLGFHLKFENAP